MACLEVAIACGFSSRSRIVPRLNSGASGTVLGMSKAGVSNLGGGETGMATWDGSSPSTQSSRKVVLLMARPSLSWFWSPFSSWASSPDFEPVAFSTWELQPVGKFVNNCKTEHLKGFFYWEGVSLSDFELYHLLLGNRRAKKPWDHARNSTPALRFYAATYCHERSHLLAPPSLSTRKDCS